MLAFMAFLRLFFYVADAHRNDLRSGVSIRDGEVLHRRSLVRAGGYSQLKIQGVERRAGSGQLGGGGRRWRSFMPLFLWWRARRGRTGMRGQPLLDPTRLGAGRSRAYSGVWALFVCLALAAIVDQLPRSPACPGDGHQRGLAMLASFGVCGGGHRIFLRFVDRPAARPANAHGGDCRTAGLDPTAFPGGRNRHPGNCRPRRDVAAFLSRSARFNYDGTQYGGPQVQKITPTDKFYQVTKNLVDPDVARDIWRFDIVGHVESSEAPGPSTELTALPAD